MQRTINAGMGEEIPSPAREKTRSASCVPTRSTAAALSPTRVWSRRCRSGYPPGRSGSRHRRRHELDATDGPWGRSLSHLGSLSWDGGRRVCGSRALGLRALMTSRSRPAPRRPTGYGLPTAPPLASWAAAGPPIVADREATRLVIRYSRSDAKRRWGLADLLNLSSGDCGRSSGSARLWAGSMRSHRDGVRAGASGGDSGVLITPRDLVSGVLEDRADDPLPVGARDPVASSVQSQ
jgi:hypothetical protein